MNNLNNKEWFSFIETALNELLLAPAFSFAGLKPSMLPQVAGVYLIYEKVNGIETALYVGRTKNLQQRLYTNHIMGNTSNARLKKYITSDAAHSCFGDVPKAKQYLKDYCFVKCIFQDDVRRRGAIEGYITARLFPNYGIYEEH